MRKSIYGFCCWCFAFEGSGNWCKTSKCFHNLYSTKVIQTCNIRNYWWNILFLRQTIKKEVDNKKRYREFEVDYKKFYKDILDDDKVALVYDKLNFMEKIKRFFEKNGLMINWKEFEKLDETQKINTLSMIAPISNGEKQKLLETISLNDKTNTLLNIIEFYSYENSDKKETIQ